MIKSKFLTSSGEIEPDPDPLRWPRLLKDEEGVLWVDIFDEPLERCRSVFKDVFGFHPLVIDDALQDSHSPKINEWDGYLYVVIHSAQQNTPESAETTTLEVDAFIGENYIVTYHKESAAPITQLWDNISQDKRVVTKGPSYILYQLGDYLVNDFLQIIDQMDEEIDQFEDVIFNNPRFVKLEEIFSRKRSLLHLRRIISYQREVYNKLSRDDFREINPENRIYFRDIYDHFVRIYDLIESLRDLISSSLDIYLSMVNNQMSQVMKTLTVFTALFMPLSFLTGFFGMNFFSPNQGFEAWTGSTAFIAALLVLVLLPIAMIAWMIKRRWF